MSAESEDGAVRSHDQQLSTAAEDNMPAQHTTFNTLDNWAIKPPPNQKGKGPERKGYRVMARNMYTIHSVTHILYFKTQRTVIENTKVT